MKEGFCKSYGPPPDTTVVVNLEKLRAGVQISPCAGCQKFSCQKYPDFQEDVKMCLEVVEEEGEVFKSRAIDIESWLAQILFLLRPVEMAEFQKKGCPFF